MIREASLETSDAPVPQSAGRRLILITVATCGQQAAEKHIRTSQTYCTYHCVDVQMAPLPPGHRGADGALNGYCRP